MKSNNVESFWHDKRVAVLGGSGFIGSHLAEELVKLNAKVTVVVRQKNEVHLRNLRSFIDKIEVREADLLNPEACERAIKGQEVVINAAAVDGGSVFKRKYAFKIFHDNVLIPLNITWSLTKASVDHYVQISSAAIYYSSNLHKSTTTEASNVFPPLELAHAYSWSKLFCEIASKFYAQHTKARVLIVRPSNVFGPRDIMEEGRMRLIPFLIMQIRKGATRVRIDGPGNRIVSFLYVKDFVANLVRIIELQKENFDIVNLASEEEITLRELCHMVAELMGKKVEFDFDPDTSPPIRNVIDVSKARRKYGFRQYYSLREGLEELLKLDSNVSNI